jgi:hypothetical protein
LDLAFSVTGLSRGSRGAGLILVILEEKQIVEEKLKVKIMTQTGKPRDIKERTFHFAVEIVCVTAKT